MSWSVPKKIGAPDKVRAAVEPEFDNIAKYYAGKTEEKDILSAKAAMLSWLDEVPPGFGVVVEASGSRGAGWLNFKIECYSCPLLV